MGTRKRKSKLKKLISIDDSVDTVDFVLQCITFAVALAICLGMIIWPLHVVTSSVRVTAVVKERTEPEYHKRYDFSDKETKKYYTCDLTVLYQDPETGEKKTGTLTAKYGREIDIHEVGQEVPIVILDEENGRHLAIAWPKSAYYMVSIMGAVGLVICVTMWIMHRLEE